MRIFTAIPVPDEVKSKLREITRGKLPVPYLSLDNLHITLNFLGELDTDTSEKALKIFPQIVEQHRQKFFIEFDKLVNFRNQIHLTLKDSPALTELQKAMEAGFKKEKIYFHEREYYPHVKLANMHLDNVMNRQRKLINFPNEILSELNFDVSKVALYESKLLLHHAHHNPLVVIDLI